MPVGLSAVALAQLVCPQSLSTNPEVTVIVTSAMSAGISLESTVHRRGASTISIPYEGMTGAGPSTGWQFNLFAREMVIMLRETDGGGKRYSVHMNDIIKKVIYQLITG
jgi:hypothetical protein